MRLLANENFPRAAVVELRRAGFDVTWIRESNPGITDPEVLAIAVAEDRLLITFDKDFGELAFKAHLPATCGIILFRIRKPSPDAVAKRAMTVLSLRTDWANHFSVIEDDRIRMTQFISR